MSNQPDWTHADPYLSIICSCGGEHRISLAGMAEAIVQSAKASKLARLQARAEKARAAVQRKNNSCERITVDILNQWFDKRGTLGRMGDAGSQTREEFLSSFGLRKAVVLTLIKAAEARWMDAIGAGFWTPAGPARNPFFPQSKLWPIRVPAGPVGDRMLAVIDEWVATRWAGLRQAKPGTPDEPGPWEAVERTGKNVQA